jgi:hypothetical protein
MIEYLVLVRVQATYYRVFSIHVSACIYEKLHNGGIAFIRGKHERCAGILYKKKSGEEKWT